MAKSKQGTHPVHGEEVKRLRELRNLSQEEVATRADISVKTLQRMEQGRNASRDNIRAVARILHATEHALRADSPPSVLPSATRFALDLSLKGHTDDPEKLRLITELARQLLDFVASSGVTLTGRKSALALVEHAGDPLQRTLALVCGTLVSGTRFWAFVAVIAHKYELFIEDVRAGTIDLSNFTDYGEVVTCGEGVWPAEHVVKRVALSYHRDMQHFVEALAPPAVLETPHGQDAVSPNAAILPYHVLKLPCKPSVSTNDAFPPK